MATHHGKLGVVKVGSNTVAEVVEWDVEETVDTVEDTAQGDTAMTHLAGIPGWTGNLRCHWDETDTNGQQAMTIGASVTLNLYPEGTGSGAKYKTGTATITKVGIGVSHQGVVSREFSFQGNGALTEAAV